jgi:hypothetical protein
MLKKDNSNLPRSYAHYTVNYIYFLASEQNRNYEILSTFTSVLCLTLNEFLQEKRDMNIIK